MTVRSAWVSAGRSGWRRAVLAVGLSVVRSACTAVRFAPVLAGGNRASRQELACLPWAARRAWGLAVLLAVVGAAPASGGAGEKAPLNVLFIASDDLNNDLGCYGHPLVKSPHVDRLADRGVRFNRAYCQYPVCNPSRSSMMTGLYPEQTGVLSNGGNFRRKLPDVVTLPQHFRNHGYFAARVGKIYHYGVPNQIGTSGVDDPASWDQVVNPRGIDRDELDRVHTLQPGQYGGTLSWLKIDSRDEQHTDGMVAAEAIRLLEEHHPEKTGRPFFLAVGFFRPHTPYVAPSHYFELYPQDKIEPVLEKPGDRDDIPLPALADRPGQRELTVAQRKEIIQAYYASISLMDAQVGRLLDALDRLGLADNTAVVFVSDHGYHLGHHGFWQKGDLFEGSCRVPLIISAPNETVAGETAGGETAGGETAAGEATDAVTELVDLYPTLVELCGLPKPEHLKGRSLAPILKDPSQPGKESALTVAWSRGPKRRDDRGQPILGRSIRTPRYRYTEWGDGKYGVELYDYREDPGEYTNLADDPAHAEVLKQMQRLMQRAKERSRG